MESNTIIKLKDVNFYYGQSRALTDISMTFGKNKVTALIGPSGCGKSTLLRLLNRMNDLIDGTRVEGEILFEEKNIYAPDVDPVEIRRKIGMVFQKPNPFPKTIYNNIAYGPKLTGVNGGDLDTLVEQSLKQSVLWDEVKDRLNDSAFVLSGGQMQRLCIARAIANGPEILLMDEPTSALDPISTAKIEEELIEGLKKDYTIIIVTHNMQQAARISDETAFFYIGNLIEYNKTEKIFTKPEVKQTEDYITGRFG